MDRFWALDGYFDFDPVVTGSDGRSYELSARLRWWNEEWTINADVSVERESESGEFNYAVLRALPARRASDWPTALKYLRAAITAFPDFDDLIPG